MTAHNQHAIAADLFLELVGDIAFGDVVVGNLGPDRFAAGIIFLDLSDALLDEGFHFAECGLDTLGPAKLGTQFFLGFTDGGGQISRKGGSSVLRCCDGHDSSLRFTDYFVKSVY